MDEKKRFRALAARYGILLMIFFISRTFVASLILYAVDFQSIKEASEHDDLSYAALMLLNSIVSYAVPLAACFLIMGKEMPSPSETAVYKRFRGESVVLYIFAMSAASASAALLRIFLEFLSSLFGTPMPVMAFGSVMPADIWQYLALVFSVVITAPVCEELIFRKYLLRPLRRYGDLTAALVSSALFSLYHTNLDQLVYTFVFGYFLALAAVRADSVVPTTIMHVINNLIVSIVNYARADLGNETLNGIFSALKASSGIFITVLEFAGLLLFVPLIIVKAFRAEKAPSCELSQGRQLALFFTSPAVIAGLVLIVLLFF